MKTAIVGRTVIPGDGSEPGEGGVLLIRDGRIERVARRVPRGYLAVDARDCTILPGLIDAHVHLCLGGEIHFEDVLFRDPPELLALRATARAQELLAAGYTTVRDMGAPARVALALRDAIRAGVVPGPRVLAPGRIITATGGHGDFLPEGVSHRWGLGLVADGPDELRRAVRTEIKAGADFIKFCATGGVLDPQSEPGTQEFTAAEMEAIVTEAHRMGRKVAAHAQGTGGIAAAIRAGVDTIEHGVFLDEETAELMRERGVFFVPTLAASHNLLREGGEGLPPHVIRKAREVGEAHRESFILALRMGVPIVAGTDAGIPFCRHGDNALELALMVELGMSPLEAITAATGRAAEALGLPTVGTLEPGKVADVIAVRGDPLDGIDILRDRGRIALVLQAGRPVAGSERGRWPG